MFKHAKIKILSFISLVCVLLSLISCSSSSQQKTSSTEIISNEKYVDFISEESFLLQNHKKGLEEYRTEVSVGYENEDGIKTIYVFSTPIRYYNAKGKLVSIDRRIKELEVDTSKDYNYTIQQSNILPFILASFNLKEPSATTFLENDMEHDISVGLRLVQEYEDITLETFFMVKMQRGGQLLA